MDKCPKCGAQVEDDAASCPECELPLAEVTASFPRVSDSEEPLQPAEPPECPTLVVRKGPEVGERFYLDRPRLTLGRDPGSDIFLNDITVSRSHATIEATGNEFVIADSGSLNGTYVNGLSIERAALQPGDSVQIGRFQMMFLSGEGA